MTALYIYLLITSWWFFHALGFLKGRKEKDGIILIGFSTIVAIMWPVIFLSKVLYYIKPTEVDKFLDKGFLWVNNSFFRKDK